MKTHIIITGLAAALTACGVEAETAQTPPQSGKVVLALEQSGASTQTAATADQGRKRFTACAVCHTVKEGDRARIGPNLFGIVGKPAGAAEGFAYSKAMSEAGIVWTEDNLNAFLENPQGFMRGNRMGFAGEKNPEYRAAIVAYLKTLKPADD
ncbi:MAG: cytochrome c family protein [Alphaproteobacteria bacterium]|nr:cytochrome c family protein [Alphaproteobacteria bacterium]